MSLSGGPKGEYRNMQREGTPVSATHRRPMPRDLSFRRTVSLRPVGPCAARDPPMREKLRPAR
jgi:hypothetical protein